MVVGWPFVPFIRSKRGELGINLYPDVPWDGNIYQAMPASNCGHLSAC